jgi:hypothetical protein
MISIEELNDAVHKDVTSGLERHLRELSFRTVRPFGAIDGLIDGDYAAIQWVYEGVDCQGNLNGMWPTGKAIEVRGLTLVDTTGDEPVFSRHIDWNAVNSQLGGSRGRASSAVRCGNFEEARAMAVEKFESLRRERGC